jgi:transcriptional regulator with XRE-family HTH domain
MPGFSDVRAQIVTSLFYNEPRYKTWSLQRMHMESGINIRLKEARELRGWSIEKAANLAGVAPRTFADWESGRKAPRVSRLMGLAGILGVAVTWLINGNDELDPHETSRSRLDKLASRLDMAVKRSRSLDSELRAIASEIKTIRRLDAEFEEMAEH